MKNLFHNLSLAKKIIAIIILISIIATIMVISVVSFTLRSSMQSQQQRHLLGVKHLVARLIEDNKRTVKNYALLFSSDRQIKDNLYYFAELAGERIHPLNAIKHLRQTFDLQFVELGNRDGLVVANALRPEQYDTDKANNILIKKALAGDGVTGIERYGDDFLLKAVAPIYHDESQLIGTISIGMLMNRDFAQIIKTLSGVEILIVDENSRVVASTLSEQVPRHTLQSIRHSITAGGQKYQVMQLPFDDSAGFPLGSVLIMAEDNVFPVLRAANTNIILVLIAISILSIVGTVLFLRRVLAPVDELRRGAKKIGSGQFDHRITVRSADEIGNLAEVFNRMAMSLQQMREVEEKLKHSERLASIGEFTAATAHEINNPIANIIGLLKVMRREIPGNDLLTDDIELVIKEANRCGVIVRDLLMYSRSSRPKKAKTDIVKLLKNSLAGLSDRHRKGKNISVQFSPPPRPFLAWVDPSQIEQVLNNLLVNALQAINNEGQVTLEVFAGQANDTIIRVVDTGCGIREADRGKIFYPFFTTKKSCEGTGLGLAVCYTIMQSHNGDIEVKSELGKGCTFTLILPNGDGNG